MSENKRWVKIAEGSNFADLAITVRDRELPIGTQLEVRMSTIWGTSWVFDLPLIESLFTVPRGMRLHDVFAEGGKGFATLEVTGYDPISTTNSISALVLPTIAGFLVWTKKHWAKILLGGLILGVILTHIAFWALLPIVFLDEAMPWLIFGGITVVAIGGYLLTRPRQEHYG